MLTAHEKEQFSRAIALEEVGETGQQRIKSARVLCVGAGGLGTPVCLYLAAAGVGELGVVDGDRIALSNVPRQILYGERDVGRHKVAVCQSRLLSQYPRLQCTIYPYFLSASNALGILAHYDVIVDCTDSLATRYLISDACVHLEKPWVSAGVQQFGGLCARFSGKYGPCYRCLFGEGVALPGDVLEENGCGYNGMLNTWVGSIGVWQAHHVLCLLLGKGGGTVTHHGEALQTQHQSYGQVITMTSVGEGLRTQSLQLFAQPDCPACQKRTPFSALSRPTPCEVLTDAQVIQCAPSLSASAVRSATQAGHTTIWLDVRSAQDQQCTPVMGLRCAPLHMLRSVPNFLLHEYQISKTDNVVIYCTSGMRSAQACALLQAQGYVSVRAFHATVTHMRHLLSLSDVQEN